MITRIRLLFVRLLLPKDRRFLRPVCDHRPVVFMGGAWADSWLKGGRYRTINWKHETPREVVNSIDYDRKHVGELLSNAKKAVENLQADLEALEIAKSWFTQVEGGLAI